MSHIECYASDTTHAMRSDESQSYRSCLKCHEMSAKKLLFQRLKVNSIWFLSIKTFSMISLIRVNSEYCSEYQMSASIVKPIHQTIANRIAVVFLFSLYFVDVFALVSIISVKRRINIYKSKTTSQSKPELSQTFC